MAQSDGTTNWKVADSIPPGISGIFFDNPTDLGLTQPLREVSTRNISWWVKVVGK